jgi:3-dehydroquinate dehydratase-2
MDPSRTIAIINGPHLNLLGLREKSLYGETTWEEVEKSLIRLVADTPIELTFYQNNEEGKLITYFQELFLQAYHKTLTLEGLVVNLGGYAHTSVALRDALLLFTDLKVPIIEVHVSHIFKREPFRHKTFISDISQGMISGLGVFGYEAALHYLLSLKK